MRKLNITAALAVALCGWIASPAMADSSLTYSQSKIWGTSPCGVSVCGAGESQSMHYYGGLNAGQVKAAEMGALFTTNYTQMNIAAGVYNQSSVTGTNNTVSSGQDGATQGNTTNKGANSISGAGSNSTFNPF